MDGSSRSAFLSGGGGAFAFTFICKQINESSTICQKAGMRRLLLGLITILYSPMFAAAQDIQSAGVAAGVHYTEDTRTTAAFAASASVRFGISWLFALQRSLADLETDTIAGTERDISLAVLPVWQPFGGRIFLGAGAALTARRM